MKRVSGRSSHRRCSVKKSVLRNFAKFTGKHLCQCLFFNKKEKCLFFNKKETLTYFPVQNFMQNTSCRLLLSRVKTFFSSWCYKHNKHLPFQILCKNSRLKKPWIAIASKNLSVGIWIAFTWCPRGYDHWLCWFNSVPLWNYCTFPCLVAICE